MVFPSLVTSITLGSSTIISIWCEDGAFHPSDAYAGLVSATIPTCLPYEEIRPVCTVPKLTLKRSFGMSKDAESPLNPKAKGLFEPLVIQPDRRPFRYPIPNSVLMLVERFHLSSLTDNTGANVALAMNSALLTSWASFGMAVVFGFPPAMDIVLHGISAIVNSMSTTDAIGSTLVGTPR